MTSSAGRITESEYERILRLADFGLDYTGLQEQLGDLTEIAAKLTGARVSLINLIDQHTQWSVARTGLNLEQMPREESVCQYIIQSAQPMEIGDLAADERFRDKSYVSGDDGLRYYYGVPLCDAEGATLGALCVLDSGQCELSEQQRELLGHLARAVMKRLSGIRDYNRLRQRMHQMRLKQRQISHDIRGPLAGIIGLAEVMHDQIDDREMQELIGMIGDSGKSVMEMCDRVLSENEVSDQECHTAVHLIEKLRAMYLPQARHKQVDLSFVAGDEGAPLPCELMPLLQIVGNLLANAIKFTPQAGEVKVVLSECGDDGGRSLVLCVHDSGVGMSPDVVASLRRVQVESRSGTSGEQGYGFGIKLVRQLVGRLGGEMTVNSTEGSGSRMEVVIPYPPCG